MKKSMLLFVAIVVASTTLLGSVSSAATSVNWLQYRRDNQRSGFNQFETTLTPSTIASGRFGMKALAYFPYAMPTPPVIYKNVLYTYAPSFNDGGENESTGVWSLYAMDAITGAFKWKTAIDCAGSASLSPAIDVAANVILIATGDRCNSESTGGALIAVDLKTHAVRYNLGSDSAGSQLAVVGGNVYLTMSGEGGGNLTSRKSATGALNWGIDGGSYANPAVGAGAVYISAHTGYPNHAPVVGTTMVYSTGGLTSYSAANGALKWTRPCAGVCAFNTSGVLKWNAPTGSGELALANNVLYMTCDATAICAVNATTGAPIWRMEQNAPKIRMTVAGGILYYVAGGVYESSLFGMLNAATGQLLDGVYDSWWSVGGYTMSAPVVNNGLVYVVDNNRINIYGLCSTPAPFKYC